MLSSSALFLPLKGIRIVDFSMQYAGPCVGAALGALGADVIKIESAKRPDITRAVRRPRGTVRNDDPSDSSNTRIFHLLNHNKRSVTLSLQHEGARALAKKLANMADIVIQAARPGVMERLGLGYADLRAAKPDIILLSVSGGGQSGPESKYGGYAPLFAALGGVTGLTGYDGEMPAEWLAITDMRVGSVAVAAVLAALAKRKATGEGEHIDLSGREVMSTLIGDAIAAFSAGARPEACGNTHRSMAPHGCFPTREPDVWFVLAIGSEQEWRALCDAGCLAALAEDQRFADGFRRWKHRDALHQEIGKWLRTEDPRPLAERLANAGVPANLCYRMDEMYADEHLRRRDVFREIQSGELGRVTVAALPWNIEGEPNNFAIAPGSRMGADNEAVYCGLLGVSEAEYESLKRAGALE